MKSMFASIIPLRALPLTVYDVCTNSHKTSDWTIPLDQIIIHKLVKNVTAEKKIDVALSPKTSTQTQYVPEHVSPV
jgi:hypothetical protein